MFGPGRELPKPDLWLPPGGLAEIEQFGEKFGVPGMFSEGFNTQEYVAGEPFETCGLTVTPIRVPHYQLQTYALRVSDGKSTLAYSGDSAPSPKLAEVGRDADLFLCEATLRESVEGGNGLRGHLSAEEAVAAFHESGARRLVIIHRPDELPLDEGIERAADGDVYTF
jgi:ribonuclease BN (tRNA processing enzyme)